MTHQRVKSSSIFSLAHDGANQMQVRFMCGDCSGAGQKLGLKCRSCGGDGHTGTYRGSVPHHVFQQVATDSQSVGKAFNRLIRSNKDYKIEKIK